MIKLSKKKEVKMEDIIFGEEDSHLCNKNIKRKERGFMNKFGTIVDKPEINRNDQFPLFPPARFPSAPFSSIEAIKMYTYKKNDTEDSQKLRLYKSIAKCIISSEKEDQIDTIRMIISLIEKSNIYIKAQSKTNDYVEGLLVLCIFTGMDKIFMFCVEYFLKIQQIGPNKEEDIVTNEIYTASNLEKMYLLITKRLENYSNHNLISLCCYEGNNSNLLNFFLKNIVLVYQARTIKEGEHKEFISYFVNDVFGKFSQSYFMLACISGNIECVRELTNIFSSHIKYTQKDYLNFTIFDYCVIFEHVDILKYLYDSAVPRELFYDFFFNTIQSSSIEEIVQREKKPISECLEQLLYCHYRNDNKNSEDVFYKINCEKLKLLTALDWSHNNARFLPCFYKYKVGNNRFKQIYKAGEGPVVKRVDKFHGHEMMTINESVIRPLSIQMTLPKIDEQNIICDRDIGHGRRLTTSFLHIASSIMENSVVENYYHQIENRKELIVFLIEIISIIFKKDTTDTTKNDLFTKIIMTCLSVRECYYNNEMKRTIFELMKTNKKVMNKININYHNPDMNGNTLLHMLVLGIDGHDDKNVASCFTTNNDNEFSSGVHKNTKDDTCCELLEIFLSIPEVINNICPNEYNQSGVLPIYFLVDKDFPKSLQLLCQKFSCPNKKRKHRINFNLPVIKDTKKTILHKAVSENKNDIVVLLTKYMSDDIDCEYEVNFGTEQMEEEEEEEEEEEKEEEEEEVEKNRKRKRKRIEIESDEEEDVKSNDYGKIKRLKTMIYWLFDFTNIFNWRKK